MAGIAVGVLGLVLTFAGIDPATFADALGRTQLGWLSIAAFSVAATLVAKALRWRALIQVAGESVGGRPALASYLVGQLANSILPLRTGEIVRAVHLSGRSGPAFGAAAGAIVAEKIVDFAIAIALAGAIFGLLGLQQVELLLSAETARLLAMLGSVIGAGVIAGSWFGLRRSRLHGGLDHRLTSRVPERIRRQLAAGAAVFGGIRLCRRWLQLAAWSGAIWLLMALTNDLIFRSLGLTLSPVVALVLLLTLQMQVVIATSLGRPGVFLFITALTLEQFGVDWATGAAAGLVLFVVVSVPPIAGGAFLLPWLVRRFWASQPSR